MKTTIISVILFLISLALANNNFKLKSVELTNKQNSTQDYMKKLFDDFTGIFKYQVYKNGVKSTVKQEEFEKVANMLFRKVFGHASGRIDTNDVHLEEISLEKAFQILNDQMQISSLNEDEETQTKKEVFSVLKRFNKKDSKIFRGFVGEEMGEAFIIFISTVGRVYMIEWHYET